MKSYGYTLPTDQKKAADFILTSTNSAEEKAFNKALDAKAKVLPTAGGMKINPPEPKPKKKPTIGDYLRDKFGRFSTR